MTPRTPGQQKRLGQYFSGERVGALLAALLPEDLHAASVVDPMAGVGDLLQAAVGRTAPGASLLGVELDPLAAGICARALPNGRVLQGDAFSCGGLRTEGGWDLVIANPPYVRYQLQSAPYRQRVRRRLLAQLEGLPYLEPDFRALLLRLAEGYSGLSDLAVPAWLLCCALVRPGGYLAIVAPGAWLSRDYARPIQYLLARSFDVCTLVRDAGAGWFAPAQVRTCLLVARRRPVSPLGDGGETLCLDLSAGTMGSTSLVEGLAYDGATGYEALRRILAQRPTCTGPGFAAGLQRTLDLFPHLRSSRTLPPWALPEDAPFLLAGGGHPPALLPLLAAEGECSFMTLEELGLRCGQGLRTGANEFFYLTLDRPVPGGFQVRGKPWYHGPQPLTVPEGHLVRTLQNRGEAEGLTVSCDRLQTALLRIARHVRPEDLPLCSPSASFEPLDPALTAYIAAAEQYRDKRGASFRSYSAVAPNEKRDRDGRYLRFWYMLPPLARRHLPALCVNRVNAGPVSCLYLPQSPQRPIAADANFVTLWGDTPEGEAAGLALLNSTWSRCYLECLCTVLGGGALKVEASHLRRLQVPRYTPAQLADLAAWGRSIIAGTPMTPSTQRELDAAVLRPFRDPARVLGGLNALLLRRLSERGAVL